MKKLLITVLTLFLLFSIPFSYAHADTNNLEYRYLSVEIPAEQYVQNTGTDIWELIATGQLNPSITAHYCSDGAESETIDIHPALCTISPRTVLQGVNTYHVFYKDMSGTRKKAVFQLFGDGEAEETFILNESNGKWYMQSSDGSLCKNIWKKINGSWYLFDNDGYVITGWYVQDAVCYYLNPTEHGAMCTGWANIDGCWYHFTDNGSFSSGWIEDNDKWYYINNDGTMKTGWLREYGRWYYLMPENGECATGWRTVSGKWYYFAENGSMAVNTVIDGYYIDENGVWIP